MTRTCLDGTCDFCATMLWAAEFEQRFAKQAKRQFERVLDELPDVEDAVEDALKSADVVSKDDLRDYVEADGLERDIQRVIDDYVDLSDYVERGRDLDNEIDERIENSGIVDDATEAAVAEVFARIAKMPLAQRLRLVVYGSTHRAVKGGGK